MQKVIKHHIKKAVKVLKDGGIVIYPTDTAFGMGCRIDDPLAIEKLFSIRRRPATQATPVLFYSVEMVKKYAARIPSSVQDKLIKQYWPGALTIILPAKIKKVPSLVRGGGLTIGTRIPDHDVPLALISGLGVPLIGTSANFHGAPTPYTLADIDPKLIYLVDYLVPGVCTMKKESTVVDCSEEQWKVVRRGAVQVEL